VAAVEGEVVEDNVLGVAPLVLLEELDVEVRLSVVTVGADGVFSTPAPSSTPMTPPGINTKLPLLQHDVPSGDGISQQYVG
jgi:hypothetical protein